MVPDMRVLIPPMPERLAAGGGDVDGAQLGGGGGRLKGAANRLTPRFLEEEEMMRQQ